jgi:hypothetical protein
MTATLSRIGAVFALCTAPLLAHADILGVSFSGRVFDVNSASAAGSVVAPAGPSFNSLASNGTTFWSVGSLAGDLVTINPTTGAASSGPLLTGLADPTSIRGLAYSTGSLWAIQNTGGQGSIGPDSLYRVDPLTGVATLIGATGVSGMQALAADSRGQLYGWDIDLGLMRVDSTTGLAVDVSTAGAVDIQALAFSSTGVLYGARDSLYTIDVATGVTTLVGAISGVGTPDLRGIEFTTAVPEPETWALLIAGLGFVGWRARRRTA